MIGKSVSENQMFILLEMLLFLLESNSLSSDLCLKVLIGYVT